ncbi:MAG: 23S rRNA (pseudouridine(1915)-N(3))-methyltransferase RlmH [Deltaproteobacteria bacterium]|jgi:23S rRNA (pseudouridine1915-N3)-methyltransferase|nr:23S rRNA (pseudouridine(1915)-N(3))-methyltransferase RlmH [Deltaproteobacteria bacterium]
MKIKVITVGKIRSRPLQELAQDYFGRLSHYYPAEIVSVKDDGRAIQKLEGSDILVVLDERGQQKGSVELSEYLSSHSMRGTKNLVFFIGGEDGVGVEMKKRANITLSLSMMTLPHELAQVVLLEQLYRACSILRGEPYHRK